MKTITKQAYRLYSRLSYRGLVVILSILSGVTFLAFLSAAHFTRSYSSDDVAIQAIVDAWQQGEDPNAIVGVDNFVLRLPLYFVSSLALNNSRVTLFLIIIICNAILLLGLLYFLTYYLRHLGLAKKEYLTLAFLPLLAFLGLAAINFGALSSISAAPLSASYLNANYRNMEIGIVFLALTLFPMMARLFEGANSLKKILAIIVTIAGLSIFIYNDPYFFYTLGVAVIFTAFIMWVLRRVNAKSAITVIVLAGTSYIGAKFIAKIGNALGFVSADNAPVAFTTIESLGGNILNSVGALLLTYRADFWGRSLTEPSTFLFLLNTSLPVLAIVALVYFMRARFADRNYYRMILMCTAILTLLAFALTPHGANIESFRYLFLAAFCLIPLSSEALIRLYQHSQYRRLAISLAVLLTIGWLVNSAINTATLTLGLLNKTPGQNTINFQVISTSREYNIQKGYSAYWDANPVTYFSNRSVIVAPLACVAGKYHQFHWLLNRNDFSKDASKTFLLVNKYDLTGFSECDPRQLGSPDKIVSISPHYDYYIYSRDIGLELPRIIPSSQ